MNSVDSIFFPQTKRGHGRKSGNPALNCRMGCDVRFFDEYRKKHFQDRGKLAVAYAVTGGKPEHWSPLKKAKDEGFIGSETYLVRGSAVILPFAYGERARITIPALNLKFGAKKEYPHGYFGTLVGRDSHGRNFLVKLEKTWKKAKNEEIKDIWVPGALLARA